MHTGQHLDQSGFAGTIVAHKRHDFPGMEVQFDIT